MGGSAVIALMVLLPLAGLVVVMGVLLILGRWVRSLRRRGKLHYSSRTTPGSDFSSSSSGM
ncbi:hypothetical protein [Microbacterium tumbae]